MQNLNNSKKDRITFNSIKYLKQDLFICIKYVYIIYYFNLTKLY